MADEKSFWEHLDELRGVIMHVILTVCIAFAVAFCFKDTLFSIVTAPGNPDFLLYRLLHKLADVTNIAQMHPEPFSLALVNTRLTGQFMVHIQMAFYAAIIISLPIAMGMVFNYLAPALYRNERKILQLLLAFGTLLFYVGVLMSYFVIVPLSVRFLAEYSLGSNIQNMIDISSYMDTLLVLTFLMGILFQLPLLTILLSKFGFITRNTMSQYRRHAILAIVIIAAVITPTTDIFTLIMVCLPIVLLYEVSRLAIK